jgi:hypothetical protein
MSVSWLPIVASCCVSMPMGVCQPTPMADRCQSRPRDRPAGPLLSNHWGSVGPARRSFGSFPCANSAQSGRQQVSHAARVRSPRSSNTVALMPEAGAASPAGRPFTRSGTMPKNSSASVGVFRSR